MQNFIPDKELLKWKNAEFLSHKLPYILQKACRTQSNFLFKMQDEDGVERAYSAEQIKGLHPGIVCFIITPLDANNNRVHVVFRGTHNKVSSRRNLKANAPGEDSYNLHRYSILQAIAHRIRNVNAVSGQKVAVTFGGHSLGGGDASRSATDLLTTVAANPHGELGSCIETINIIHKNSVGVSATTARNCKDAVKKIRKKLSNKELKINYYPMMVVGDTVSRTGYTAILSDATPAQVNTNMLRVDIAIEEKFSIRTLIFDGPIATIKKALYNIYHRHKFKIFNEDTLQTTDFEAKKTKFDFQSNSNAEGRSKIYKELNYKILQNAYESVRSLIRKPIYIFRYPRNNSQVSPERIAVDVTDRYTR